MKGWKRDIKFRRKGVPFVDSIGGSSMPVVRVTGYGYHDGFADPNGDQLTYLNFELPEGFGDDLPVGRNRGYVGGRSNDGKGNPDKASIGILMGQEERMSLIRHLLETCQEYDRAFPVKARSRTSPQWRSRS